MENYRLNIQNPIDNTKGIIAIGHRINATQWKVKTIHGISIINDKEINAKFSKVNNQLKF